MFLSKKTNVRIFLFLLSFFYLADTYASTHSRLNDPKQLKRFKEISLKLVCQCGCKMLLDSCNHLTCMAWSMRSVIDSLILHGHSNSFILNGFEKGFGSMPDDPKLMPVLQEKKYSSYKAYYKNGFGSIIYSEPQNQRLAFWILISVGSIFIYVFIFIYRKKKKITGSDKSGKLTEQEKELWESLYRG